MTHIVGPVTVSKSRLTRCKLAPSPEYANTSGYHRLFEDSWESYQQLHRYPICPPSGTLLHLLGWPPSRTQARTRQTLAVPSSCWCPCPWAPQSPPPQEKTAPRWEMQRLAWPEVATCTARTCRRGSVCSFRALCSQNSVEETGQGASASQIPKSACWFRRQTCWQPQCEATIGGTTICATAAGMLATPPRAKAHVRCVSLQAFRT